jgi:PAS domain S-box-containing protein
MAEPNSSLNNIPDSIFKSIIENSNDAILVVSGSTLVYANKTTAQLCGYNSPDEMIGRDALEFISSNFRDVFRKRIKRRLNGEQQPQRFDHEILQKNGSIVQVESTASVIEYDNKPAVLFIGRDITERKKFELKLFALHKYAAQLGAAQTLVEISEPTMKAINSVIGFQYANFMLKEDDHMGSIDSIGYEGAYWNTPIDGKGAISRATRQGRTVIIKSPEEGLDARFIEIGINSQIATPVVINNNVEAVISIESIQKNAFTGSDTQILEIIAQHAGSALERIELT